MLRSEQKQSLKQMRSMPGWQVLLELLKYKEEMAWNSYKALPSSLPAADFAAQARMWQGRAAALAEVQRLLDDVLAENS